MSNLLIHREFSNGFPAKLIIQQEQVCTENWSRPNGGGLIDPSNFAPFPKNPLIARFFKEIGRVDELGSGVVNVFRYTSIYSSGGRPQFIEGDVFKTIIPLTTREIVEPIPARWEKIRATLGDGLGEKLGENEWKILEILLSNPNSSISTIAKSIGISTTAVENNIRKMRKKQLLEHVGPAKGGHWKINFDV